MAAQMLSGRGFKKVYNVSGGIKAWKSRVAVGDQTLGLDLFDGSQTPEEILRVAYSLEEGLRGFYEDMAAHAENEKVKVLFDTLAAIEIRHQDTIFKTYQQMAVSQPMSREAFDVQITRAALEGGMTTGQYLEMFAPDLSRETDVISLAMSIEAQALDLYLRVGNRVADPESRAVILGIAEDEKAHLKSLGRLMDTL